MAPITNFYDDVLLPHLRQQDLADALIEQWNNSKIVVQLNENNKDLVATYNPATQLDTALDNRLQILLYVLSNANVLVHAMPATQYIDEKCVFCVKFPRLCHAVLFAADLLLHKRSPLLQPSAEGLMWNIVRYSLSQHDELIQDVLPLNNPSYFVSHFMFWLQRRKYEPSDVLLQHAAHWAQQHNTKRLMTSSPPIYWNELEKMNIYELVFYVCLENAAKENLITITHRLPKSQRPIVWQVTSNAANIKVLVGFFPEYFWKPESKTIWLTHLCLFCSNDSKAEPWTQGLKAGQIYNDYRIGTYADTFSTALTMQMEFDNYNQLPTQ